MRAGGVAVLMLGAILVGIGGADPASPTPPSQSPAPAPVRYVALISIDGLRPHDSIHPEACGSELLALTDLMQSGTYAEGVAGVLPTMTYPSHATLVTGAYPLKHGVLTNERPRDKAPWHLDRSDIKATALWDSAHRAGMPVAIVTWPSTYGADVDYLIPENLSAATDVTDLVRRGSTPGLFQELESAGGAVRLLPFDDPEAGVPLDRMTASFAAGIVRRYRPRLLLLHFLDLDHREHADGPGSAEACRALRRIDGLVGQVRAAYREAGLIDETAFVIVSDHGFLRVHTTISVPSLLAQAGWATIDKGRGTVTCDLEYRVAGATAAFYGRRPGDAALARRVETDLRPRIEPRNRGLVRWLPPDEARRLGGFPGAAFVLCAAPGYAFGASPAPAGAVLEPSVFRGTHGYCPDETGMDAAFIASGSGVRRLGEIPRIRMIDIAPTVAALLGVDLPDADGQPIAGLLDRADRP